MRALAGKPAPGNLHIEELSKIESDLEQLAKSLESRLSLVVMGEVKSGKSTLINALAGDTVSPTDVLEATATILEIEHSAEPHGTIVFTDGSQQAGKPADIFAVLEENRGDESFFARCSVVRLGLPLAGLSRLRIVDTPGLATVTEANAQVAQNYIQQADVVLWVLNGLHLGQSDVIGELAEVAKLGKRIVVVINRIDQVDSSPQRLVSYVRREYAAYSDEVFPISALKAFDGVRNEDQSSLDESGFVELLDYLESQLDEQADEVKVSSVLSSTVALVRLDKAIHESYERELANCSQLVQDNYEELYSRSNSISERIQDELRERAYNELLINEFRQIQAAKNPSPEMVNSLLSRASVEAWWKRVSQETLERIEEEWKSSFDELFQKQVTALERFAAREQRALAVTATEITGQMDDMVSIAVDGSIRGALAGGATAVGMAAYAAWFGPSAAYVGIGSAAVALVPPAAVIGAIGGLVFGVADHWMTKRQQESERLIAIQNQVRDVQRQFIESFLEPVVFPAVETRCNEKAAQLHTHFVQNLSAGWSDEQIEDTVEQLRAYIRQSELLDLQQA